MAISLFSNGHEYTPHRLLLNSCRVLVPGSSFELPAREEHRTSPSRHTSLRAGSLAPQPSPTRKAPQSLAAPPLTPAVTWALSQLRGKRALIEPLGAWLC